MTSLSIQDHESLLHLIYMTMGLSFIASFVIYGFLNNIFKLAVNLINFPYRIKTEQGYLYRSLNGTYVSKQRVEDIKIERKLKRKNHFIKYHEHVLKRLKS